MSQTQQPQARFFITGGTLSSEAESYIVRAADTDLLNALTAGKFAYVLNSRQMGKSSLCVRTMKRLEEAGVWTAFVDLTKIGGKNATIEQWYTGIAVEIGHTPSLRSAILAYWKENGHLSPMQRLFGVLRDVVLTSTEQPVAIFFDEIDATRSLSFSPDEFFAAIRECYNRRVQDPVYERLTFCLLGVAVPSDLINSPTSTPFNIGERIYLRDFTLEEAMALASGLGANGRAILERAYYWTNGHPYLTQSLCSAIAADSSIKTAEDVDSLVTRDLFEPSARETNINLADVANRALHAGDLEPEPEKFRADLLSAYEKARNGKVVPDDEANRVAALLKLSGIMRSDGKRLYVRNRIYEHVFDREWIRENMPGQELRRQKRAFYLGVLRTGLVSVIVVAVITALALNSLRLAHIASEQRDLARYEAYAADLNLMRSAYNDNDLIQLSHLLDETKNSPSRNFEWDYWNTKLHDANYQTDLPNGFGNVIVANDGKSVAINDAVQQKGAIYSYPELHLIHKIDHLARNQILVELAGRWAIGTVAGTSAVPFVDAINGAPIGAVGLGSASFVGVNISEDARSIIASVVFKGDHYPEGLYVLDAKTLQIIRRFKVNNRRISSQAVSNDGRIIADEEVNNESPTLAENYFKGREVVVRDLSSGAEIDRFASGGLPAGFQLSGDGRFLEFSLPTSGTVKVRDVRAHRFIFDLAVSRVFAMSFSGDGSKILTVGADLAACLWDLKTGRLLEKRRGAMAASMPRDASSIVVSGAGTRVYTANGVDRDVISIPNTWAIIFGLNSKGWLVVNTGNAMRFFDGDSLKVVHPYVRLVTSSAGVSSNSDWRLSALKTGGSEIVNTETDAVMCRLPVWNSNLHAMDVSPTRIALIDDGFRYAICYDRSGKELWRYDSKTAPVTNVAWSPDGEILAISKINGEVWLLDGQSGRVRRTLTGYSAAINNLAFSHDGHKLAVAGLDFRVPVFDVDKDIAPVICRGHTGNIELVKFSPDDSRLATASDDGTARLWDPKTGTQMLQIDVGETFVTGIAFHPDDQRLYVSDQSGAIRVFRAPKLEGDGKD